MKDKQIFPSSVLDQSANQIFAEKNNLTGIIYLVVLFALVGVLIAINFIRIDVTVKAPGIIKPREDHTVVLTTIGGYIEPGNLVANAHVTEGDTLAIIKSELIKVKLPSLLHRKKEHETLISDLKQLTTKDPWDVQLVSPMYKQDALYFISQWMESEAKRKQAQISYDRGKQLYEDNVISLSEFENLEMSLFKRKMPFKLENPL